MKIIKPYAKIISEPSFKPMQQIEWCARISHRSEEAQTADSWKRFIQAVVIDHGDWSVVEHVSVSVDAVVDRGITHEWVRHRLFSFTQESTRFVSYAKKMKPSFVYPIPNVECLICFSGEEPEEVKGHTYPWIHVGPSDCPYSAEWLCAIDQCESSYQQLIIYGWHPQEARSVFPNALASRIIITGNLRNWRHFLIMRTSQEAHPQMKQVTIPLLAEFKATFPILFDDIEPNQKQSEAMRRVR